MELLLIKYLAELDHIELLDRNDLIQFFYQEQQIQFRDQTIIENYFKNNYNPIIFIIDRNNSLCNNLTKKNIIFKTITGYSTNVLVNYGTTIDQLLKKYLYKFGNLELIDKCYKNNNLIDCVFDANFPKFGDQRLVEKFLVDLATVLVTIRQK